MHKHSLKLIYSVGGKSGDGDFVRAIVDTDDAAVAKAKVVIVSDNRLKELSILFEHIST